MKYRSSALLSLLFILTVQYSYAQSIRKLNLLGEYDVPYNLSFRNTTVGGLSGIDYDAKHKIYYLISDDRSAINPARFYTAKLFFTEKGIDSVAFTGVKYMLQANGTAYPNSKQDPAHTPDPESIRYNATTHQLIWTSEGERIVKAKDTVLENPAITIMSTDGKFIDSFPLPVNLRMHAFEKGPRQNGVLEGATFSKDYKQFYVNVEEPLYEDGTRAETEPNDAWIRLFKFNTATKKNIAQYAYHIDPVAHPAITKEAFKINGVPDILWLNDQQLLVMERSFSTGRLACTIKIYLADLHKASNVMNNSSFKKNSSFVSASKKLLLNMDTLGRYIDNVEGMTFGPTLPNGHRTLLMIADNNFSPVEKTQFFLFEVIP
ncbi:MAG: esterase-like activity of phytase family protein [Bacteroidota bacterium]|nr:esterase-like activity of phytase family protein [Bacteroidota bacterium]